MPEGDTPVYLGLTRTQLDAQYDQRTAVPHAGDYMRRWAAQSADLRRTRRFTTHAYGTASIEKLDIFEGEAPNQMHMHIHGGAWRALTKEEVSFVVSGLGIAGRSVAVVDFDAVQDANLRRMVDQVRRAFLWLRARHPGQQLSVSGHSSGAHLAACLLDARWWAAAGLTSADFAGLVLASGPYDLEPVQLSARNDYIRLTLADVKDLSPARHLPHRLPPLAVHWGAQELDEFIRQSQTFAAACAPRAASIQSGVLDSLNHFDIYDLFADSASMICRFLGSLPRQTAPEIINQGVF